MGINTILHDVYKVAFVYNFDSQLFPAVLDYTDWNYQERCHFSLRVNND